MLFLLTIGTLVFGRSAKLLALLPKSAFKRGGIEGSSESVLKDLLWDCDTFCCDDNGDDDVVVVDTDNGDFWGTGSGGKCCCDPIVVGTAVDADNVDAVAVAVVVGCCC